MPKAISVGYMFRASGIAILRECCLSLDQASFDLPQTDEFYEAKAVKVDALPRWPQSLSEIRLWTLGVSMGSQKQSM